MISFKAGYPHDIVLLSFSPDAGLLAVGLEWQRTEFRDPTTGELTFALDRGCGRNALFWGGANRRTLFVHRPDDVIIPIDPDERQVLPRLKGWGGNGAACFTSDGQFGINTQDHYQNADLICWKLTPGGVTRVWTRQVQDARVQYRTPHLFLPDDDHFVYTERRGRWGAGLTIVVASRTDPTNMVEGYFPNHEVGYGGTSPCGSWLALGAAYGPSIHVYRTDDLKAAPIRLTSKSRKHYTGLAFHPSGQYMAATSNDATVTFFDTQTFTEARAFTWKIGRLRSVAFSPDGALTAVGSDKGQVVVWDVDV